MLPHVHKPKHVLLFIALGVLLILLLFLWPTSGLTDHATTHHNITLDEKRDIIKTKLAFYNKKFPKIKFILAEGGNSWYADFLAVTESLGEGAANMDYEHPPELTQDLLDVNLERLAQMLKHNIVSSALFKVGKGSVISRPMLCVLTLNPKTYIGDSKDALHYMLDLRKGLLHKVHPARYLDTYEHLRFTIDHEAFHCLDSFFQGGAPMTQKKLGGEYNLFYRESAADAFALGMQMRNAGELSDYATNITLIRSLWLFTESPNRCTYDSMLAIYKTPASQFKKMSLKEVFNTAVRVSREKVGSYDFYVNQRATAFKAAKILGHAPKLYGDAWIGIDKIATDPKQVEYKIKRYRYYFSQLFTNNPIEFTPADLLP